MSAEEGSTQPPAAGSDKAPSQPAKPAPAAFTSSFINKNTTGKKFAPKAARRRPAPAAAAPKPTAPEPTPPAVEAQTAQPEVESTIAAEEPAVTASLPTPVATQEQSTQNVQESVQPTPQPPSVQEPTPTPAGPLPTPASSSTEALARAEEPLDTPIAVGVPSQDDVETGRATKRRRVESPVVEPETAVAESSQHEPDVPAQARRELSAGAVAQDAEEDATHATDGAAGSVTEQTVVAPANEGETAASSPQSQRIQPWAAVNRPAEVEGGEPAPEPALVAPKKARQPPKPRGRRKAAAATEAEIRADEEGAVGEDGVAEPVRKRTAAKARGKRNAAAPTGEDGAEEPAPAAAKRVRKPRKAKTNDGVAADQVNEDGVEEQAEEGQEFPARRKPRQPRQPRRRKQAAAEGEGGNEEASQPKKKGRPPREPTPEDAEDHEIDPENTYMDSIAYRNIRVGKLSAREKAMREIDWVAVKQRQREEDARPIATKEAREAAEQLLVDQAPQDTGPRFEVVDGQIRMTHASNTLDREAQADREIENYEVVEERDLTTRITSRSFMKNNKRFPNDFLLPGQGKKWSLEETDRFYEGLRHFGTDFQMISHMFPGSTRRSIKLKFTREERENPDGIREILLSRSTIDSHWDKFIEVSQMEEEKFADAESIKAEMAAHEAEMREKIKAAKAETEERKRQQREAGLLDDENGEGGDKENGKGKKKRKGKEKQVTFQEEAGVEILGNVDDDETWGQE